MEPPVRSITRAVWWTWTHPPRRYKFWIAVIFQLEKRRKQKKILLFVGLILVAFEGDKPIGKLLCITRRNFRLLGFTEKTYVYGVGEYFNTERKREEIFNELLTYFTTLYKEGSFLLEFRFAPFLEIFWYISKKCNAYILYTFSADLSSIFTLHFHFFHIYQKHSILQHLLL